MAGWLSLMALRVLSKCSNSSHGSRSNEPRASICARLVLFASRPRSNIATLMGFEPDSTISRCCAVSAQPCGNQRLKSRNANSLLCTIRANKRVSTVRFCPTFFSAPDNCPYISRTPSTRTSSFVVELAICAQFLIKFPPPDIRADDYVDYASPGQFLTDGEACALNKHLAHLMTEVC